MGVEHGEFAIAEFLRDFHGEVNDSMVGPVSDYLPDAKRLLSLTPLEEIAEVLRCVVMDYAAKCCDNLPQCDCSMGRAARLVTADFGGTRGA